MGGDASADDTIVDTGDERAPLTRERILQVALEIADREGLRALTMRRLGQALGVEAMSLYYHLPNKDAILDGIVDLVVSEIDLPRPDLSWREALRQRALSAHAVLLRHPWAAHQLLSRINTGPAMLRYVDATYGCLFAAGFSVAQADEALYALDSHIYGFTLQRQLFPVAPDAYADTAREHAPRLDPALHPHLLQAAEAILTGTYDGQNQFTFGLDLLLDGLARLLPE